LKALDNFGRLALLLLGAALGRTGWGGVRTVASAVWVGWRCSVKIPAKLQECQTVHFSILLRKAPFGGMDLVLL
jgi:hypothetical protein